MSEKWSENPRKKCVFKVHIYHSFIVWITTGITTHSVNKIHFFISTCSPSGQAELTLNLILTLLSIWNHSPNPKLAMRTKWGAVKSPHSGGFSSSFCPHEDIRSKHNNKHTHRFTHTPEPWAQIRCMSEADGGLEHKSLWNGTESKGLSSEVALACADGGRRAGEVTN